MNLACNGKASPGSPAGDILGGDGPRGKRCAGRSHKVSFSTGRLDGTVEPMPARQSLVSLALSPLPRRHESDPWQRTLAQQYHRGDRQRNATHAPRVARPPRKHRGRLLRLAYVAPRRLRPLRVLRVPCSGSSAVERRVGARWADAAQLCSPPASVTEHSLRSAARRPPIHPILVLLRRRAPLSRARSAQGRASRAKGMQAAPPRCSACRQHRRGEGPRSRREAPRRAAPVAIVVVVVQASRGRRASSGKA
eukprot:scaffold104_cov375-Prasinococcus_capsulatus_cf.AAC.7